MTIYIITTKLEDAPASLCVRTSLRDVLTIIQDSITAKDGWDPGEGNEITVYEWDTGDDMFPQSPEPVCVFHI